jgi:hypothetical protein
MAPNGPLSANQHRLGSQDLDDAAHSVGAVQRGGGAANDFGAFGRIRIDQSQVLVGRVAKNGIIQAHAIDQVQHLRSLQPTDDGDTLAWGSLLEKRAGHAAQHLCEQLGRLPPDIL